MHVRKLPDELICSEFAGLATFKPGLLPIVRYEKRRGLEANFVHLFEGNSQVAIFMNKCTKFDREITFFRLEKPKTQVIPKA
jgi:hypothetical protein